MLKNLFVLATLVGMFTLPAEATRTIETLYTGGGTYFGCYFKNTSKSSMDQHLTVTFLSYGAFTMGLYQGPPAFTCGTTCTGYNQTASCCTSSSAFTLSAPSCTGASCSPVTLHIIASITYAPSLNNVITILTSVSDTSGSMTASCYGQTSSGTFASIPVNGGRPF